MSPRHLLSAGLIAAFAGLSAPARAVDLVLDPTQAVHAVAELAQLANEYRVLFCSYQQQQATTAALQHTNPDVMDYASGLQNNRLPGSPASAIPGLNFGSTMSGPGQQFYNQNTVYTPQGTDFSAQEMQRQAMATANLQGEAAMGMQRINQRVAMLGQLQAAISTQPDVQSVAALNARIASEKLYIANEANNVAQMNNLLQTQQLVNQQRTAQHARQQEDENAAAAASAAGWSAQ